MAPTAAILRALIPEGQLRSGAAGQPQAEVVGLEGFLESREERRFRELPPPCEQEQWL